MKRTVIDRAVELLRSEPYLTPWDIAKRIGSDYNWTIEALQKDALSINGRTSMRATLVHSGSHRGHEFYLRQEQKAA